MAAARAAARRQAILNSRGDRLAKLTSSARGEDPGGVYSHDDPPLPTLGTGLKTFVGEETTLPTPRRSVSPPPDWGSAEQQQEFIRALMSGAAVGQPGLQPPPISGADPNAPAAPEDPISALLASFGGGAFGAQSAPAPPVRTRTLVHKLVPVLHLLSMVVMLVWFVMWKEPEVWGAAVSKDAHEGDWKRWARLARGPPVSGLTVPSVPTFFWAFTTLQLGLQSLRIISQPNAYRPPMLLGLVLPYLPPPLPLAITTSLKYFQMGSVILDDLAILVFGIGLLVFVSNWTT